MHVMGIHTQSNTLAHTNDDTPTNEAADIVPGRKCLHEGCNDNEKRARGHSSATAGEISERTTNEETCDDGSDGVGGVDGTLSLRVLQGAP